MRRSLDFLLSGAALVLLAPVFGAAALAIFLESGKPVLFSQMRVGRNGRLFRLWKFRSMQTRPAGLPITVGEDRRVTRVGWLLRGTKLDELPQLFNIFRGDMSIIGPRPEVPMFVDTNDTLWRAALSVRPGLVDPAYLDWPDEDHLLSCYADPVAAYREEFLPRKLALSLRYMRHRNLLTDLKLMFQVGLTILYGRLGKLKTYGG